MNAPTVNGPKPRVYSPQPAALFIDPRSAMKCDWKHCDAQRCPVGPAFTITRSESEAAAATAADDAHAVDDPHVAPLSTLLTQPGPTSILARLPCSLARSLAPVPPPHMRPSRAALWRTPSGQCRCGCRCPCRRRLCDSARSPHMLAPLRLGVVLMQPGGAHREVPTG